MKTRITKIAIYIVRDILSAVYFLLKLLPSDGRKIVFCSRQSNDIPLDFQLIQKELDKTGDIRYVNICCHIGQKTVDYFRFFTATVKSMYHLATSKVCVLDSYWPVASILNHKRQLVIIQTWHALGKIKKSGYQTLGKKSGRKKEYAELLKMHRNYDYVIAGAPIWNRCYCESFDIDENKILNYGLPRIDYLIETEEENKKRFFREYPQMEGKKIILYAPTFRRNMRSGWEKIVEAVKDTEYVLVIKKHPGEKNFVKRNAPNVYYMDHWKTIDLIAVCDCFITDYSASALEAAVLSKPTYYWIYDYDEYVENNGLNFEIREKAAERASGDIEEIMDFIGRDVCSRQTMADFRQKYLPEELGRSTELLGELIKGIIDDTYEKNRDNGRWERNEMEELHGHSKTFRSGKRRRAYSQNR